MATNLCPVDDVSALASLARDICPFPDYSPSPLFSNMLSINSSSYLKEHYKTVQSSLSPEQLVHFTHSLRGTFGREGRVSYGGVGVVALSLAVLFDTLAKQARGEQVLDSGPVPDLFFNPRGASRACLISDYLRLVPYVVNNPERMKQETERFLKEMMPEIEAVEVLRENGNFLLAEARPQLNVIMTVAFTKEADRLYKLMNGTNSTDLYKTVYNGPVDTVILLNCDTKTADKQFLDEVEKSGSHSQELFKKHVTRPNLSPILQTALQDFWGNVYKLRLCARGLDDSTLLEREDFDLKANALGRWGE